MADLSGLRLHGGAGEGRHGYGKRWFAKWLSKISLKKFYPATLVLMCSMAAAALWEGEQDDGLVLVRKEDTQYISVVVEATV